MYLDFYGFREAPFSPTPDPRFLFQSALHREALAQLLYGVRERKGFMVLTGEIGTGKTTLLRTLLARLEGATRVAYLHNSALPMAGLMEYTLQDFGVKSVAASHAQRLIELNEFLIEQHRRGLAPVLVLDEAQHLSVEALEGIRLLSNFETTQHKLLQIVLVGQPELRARLADPALRQLKQRIALRCHIGPLAPEEVRLYIRHRLRVAGGADLGLFGEAAMQRIALYSRGVPRVVNIVCDHCLLIGYAESKRRIDARIVDEAIDYLEEGEQRRWSRRRPDAARPRLVPELGVIGLLVMVLLAMAAMAAGTLGWLPLPGGAP